MIGDLLNHVWQSTLFAFAVGLLTAALHKNRASVRYWLWLTASLKFFVPFSLLVTIGSHLRWASTEGGITAATVPVATIAQIAQPFSAVLPSVATAPQTTMDWAHVVIFGSWVFGFGAILLMRLREWRRIRAAVRNSTSLTIPGVGLQVRSSPDLLEPSVVGWRRVVLLVPAGVEERLAPPQLGAVLAHELCHARRRDNLTAAIHMVTEAIFWFHPLVWWIGARLVDERERACDEHVLQVFGQPQAYVEGILTVCKLYVEPPLACVSGVTGSNVKKRIEDIMNNHIGVRLNVPRKAALALALTVAIAAPITVGVFPMPLKAQARPRMEDSSALMRTKETVFTQEELIVRLQSVRDSTTEGTNEEDRRMAQTLASELSGEPVQIDALTVNAFKDEALDGPVPVDGRKYALVELLHNLQTGHLRVDAYVPEQIADDIRIGESVGLRGRISGVPVLKQTGVSLSLVVTGVKQHIRGVSCEGGHEYARSDGHRLCPTDGTPVR